MAGHGDAVAWEDLPAKEQQRIAQRQEKKQQARMEYYKGAVKWGVIMGTVGVAGHFAGNKFCTWCPVVCAVTHNARR